MAVKERRAARALVSSPGRRILLMRYRFPWLDADLRIAPGGGVDRGEPHAGGFEAGGETEWFREFRWWPVDRDGEGPLRRAVAQQAAC